MSEAGAAPASRPRQALSSAEQQIRLGRLAAPDWQIVDGRRLEKTYRLSDFASALDLVQRIGAQAARQNHHPEILLSWGRVEVRLWTHDVGGLTERDFILAAACDAERAALAS